MPATTLTDTQLVILSAASQRTDRGIVLPANLKGGAAQKLVAKLIDLGLAEELRARGELPIWRRDDNDRPTALRITKRGLHAIAIDEESAVTEDAPADKSTLDVHAEPESTAAPAKPRREVADAGQDNTGVQSEGQSPAGRARSKQSQIIDLLQRPEGVTIAVVMATTGWQQHSVRGFFAGAVRKKLGLDLVSEKVGDERVYRIMSPEAPQHRTKEVAQRAA